MTFLLYQKHILNLNETKQATTYKIIYKLYIASIAPGARKKGLLATPTYRVLRCCPCRTSQRPPAAGSFRLVWVFEAFLHWKQLGKSLEKGTFRAFPSVFSWVCSVFCLQGSALSFSWVLCGATYERQRAKIWLLHTSWIRFSMSSMLMGISLKGKKRGLLHWSFIGPHANMATLKEKHWTPIRWSLWKIPMTIGRDSSLALCLKQQSRAQHSKHLQSKETCHACTKVYVVYYAQWEQPHGCKNVQLSRFL